VPLSSPPVGWRRVVAGIGRTFIASGVLILLFVAYQLWGTGLSEARAQDRLRADFLDALQSTTTTSTTSRSTTTTTDGDGTTSTTAAPAPAARQTPTGEAVAIIRIPKIDVTKAVIEGVSVGALKKGPGHYPSTPLPGQPGNAAIAGHRTTYGAPFFRLDELAPGDRIEVTTKQGEFVYRVTETKIVKPSQNEVLAPTEDNRLTLTTCHPRFSAAQRMIVTAALTDEPVEPLPPPVTVPADDGTPDEIPGDDLAEDPADVPTLDDDATVSGESASKWPAIGWGALAGLIWLVTWLLSKKWGRVPAYAMGVPVFLVVLFVFFENFARLLPANV
jgi:sortase A